MKRSKQAPEHWTATPDPSPPKTCPGRPGPTDAVALVDPTAGAHCL
ncbi:hypothetical protein L2K20_10365 [Mycobacterium sp. MBM]|nr:hypothetical protein [Mycobacterium sp. MBM]